MQIESVSYIFGRGEMDALLTLLDCDGIPCSPVTGGTETDIKSLEASSLITGSEGRYVVDRLTAFLVKAVGEADRYVCLYGEDSYLGLIYTPMATIVLRLDRSNRWVLEPFQSFGAGREVMLDYSAVMSAPFKIMLKNAKGVWSCSVSSGPEEIRRKLLYAAEWLYFNDVPYGKDVTTWKP